MVSLTEGAVRLNAWPLTSPCFTAGTLHAGWVLCSQSYFRMQVFFFLMGQIYFLLFYNFLLEIFKEGQLR